MRWPWSRSPSPEDIPELLRDADRSYRAGDPKKAARLYRTILKVDRRNLAALVNLGGLCSQSFKTLPESRNLLEKACELEPNNPTVLLNLGAIYAYLNRLDEALVCLNRLEETDAGYPGLRYNRANVLFRMGRVRDAFVEIQEELRANPKNPNAILLQEVLRQRMQEDSPGDDD
jgi:tetratricopeptide (TPR) repeat protein